MAVSETKTGRIAQLTAMLAARTDSAGVPNPGMARNVEAIRTELKRLKSRKKGTK